MGTDLWKRELRGDGETRGRICFCFIFPSFLITLFCAELLNVEFVLQLSEFIYLFIFLYL